MEGVMKKRYARRKTLDRVWNSKRSNPDEGSILTWILIGVGGYLIWNWWSSQTVTATTTTTTAPGTTAGTVAQPTTVTNTTAPVVTPTVTANLNAPLSLAIAAQLNAVLAKAGYTPAKTMNGYQWDYYGKMAFGSSYINIQYLQGIVGANTYNETQYLQAFLNALATQQGNVNSLAGLGAVSPTTLMYRKMLAPGKGWSVGDFASTKASASESGWIN